MPDEIFDPNQRQELDQQLTEPRFSLKDFLQKNKLIMGVSAAALLAVLAALGILFWGSNDLPAPSSNNVFLAIKGPSQINSGSEAEYQVVYRNGENSDLVSASLEVFYPSGAKFKTSTPASTSGTGSRFNLPLIKAGSSGDVTLRLKLSGATAEDKLIAAKMTYKLADFNSEFEVKAEAHTLILSPNLTLDINGPIDVVNGQETTFTVGYSNVSSQDFENLVLELIFPEGFETTAKTTFSIPKLAIGASGAVDITGVFFGEGEEKLVVAELGQHIGNQFAPQLSTSATFKIIPAALYLKIQTEPKEVVNLGQTIEFDLDYGNSSSVGMTNVVITLTFDSTIVDFARMNVYNAVITGNTITWKSATLSNLKVLGPSQKGEISFTAPIKSNPTSNVKNLSVKAVGTIRSDQMPKTARSAEIELKLASELHLIASGGYVSGPAPMQVGKTTNFDINFLLTNTSNDINSAELTAALLLPPGAWANLIAPEQEKNNLTYDANSGVVRWKVGALPAYTGKYTPARTVTFRLAVTPAESDRGKAVKFLSNIQASGTDAFTGLEVKSELISDLSSNNLDDDDFERKGTAVE